MRREAPPDYQGSPDYLHLALFGGRSSVDGKHYEGLAARVQHAVAVTEDTDDLHALYDYACRFIGEPVALDPPREHIHATITRANGRASRMIKPQRHHLPERNRLAVRDLVLYYTAWLHRRCPHARAEPVAGGTAQECPDCRALIVDIDQAAS